VTVKQIRESGLLEYYVLGLLDRQEASRVEGYLLQYPELHADYLQIQRTMESYAQSKGLKPSRDLTKDIRDLIRKDGSHQIVEPPSIDSVPAKTANLQKSRGSWLGTIVFALAATALLWSLLQQRSQYAQLSDRLDEVQSACDSVTTAQKQELDSYRLIQDKDSRTVPLAPTDGYKDATLILHTNELLGQNYIQVKNLPNIAAGEAFQLWSLKEGQDPMPLTVFKDGTAIIPVAYEQGTATYAITIEQESGALTPDLTKLIGTLSV